MVASLGGVGKVLPLPRLVGRPLGRLPGRSAGRLVAWMADWMAGWMAGLADQDQGGERRGEPAQQVVDFVHKI